MQELYSQLMIQLGEQSGWEMLAVVLAFLYVIFAARQNIWCWLCALLSTAIYTYLFWEVSLPFQTLLNVYYLLMAVYGWRQWKKGGAENHAIGSLTAKQHVMSVAILTIISVMLSAGLSAIYPIDYVYTDAFIAVFSVFATVLVAHKIRENWLYWLVIDAVAAYLYLQKGLEPTAILFVVYLVIAAYGYFQWGKNLSENASLSEA